MLGNDTKTKSFELCGLMTDLGSKRKEKTKAYK